MRLLSMQWQWQEQNTATHEQCASVVHAVAVAGAKNGHSGAVCVCCPSSGSGGSKTRPLRSSVRLLSMLWQEQNTATQGPCVTAVQAVAGAKHGY